MYSPLVKKLDAHIDSVKNKISEAEAFKNEAYVALKRAYIKKDDTEEIIRVNRVKSEEKIRRMQEENEKLLQHLRERHEMSLKMQLDAEFARQKNMLVERLSDLILEKISERVADSEYEILTSIDKDDLRKLLGSRH
jgi:hypothetical protein